MDRHQTGKDAEQSAKRFLCQQGLTLITQNYHCRWGEIDLIMQHRNELVFIEVRLRRHQSYGGAALSVDLRKQRKIIKTAQHYLQQHKSDKYCRFDVIAFEGSAASLVPIWYKDAFRT